VEGLGIWKQNVWLHKTGYKLTKFQQLCLTT